MNAVPGFEDWTQEAKLIERARIVLAVCLSKRPPGELARIILDWLEDRDLQAFCLRYLDESDVRFILEARRVS